MLSEPSDLSPRHAIAALMLLGALGLGTLYDVIEGPDDARSERIARTPELPTSPGSAVRFASGLRHYLDNRYALRNWFIETNSAVKLALFGHADYPDVLLGEDGFLFLATEGTIPMAQNAAPFGPGEAEAWAQMFAAQDESFAEIGLPYVFILAPSKHTVYGDQLPQWLQESTVDDRPRRTDAVMDRAATSLRQPATDLRPVFAEARAADPALLYHRTDTHWNELGAAIGVAAALAEAGYETRVPAAEIVPTGEGGDLARMLGRQPQSSEAAPAMARQGWGCVGPDGAALEIVTLDPLLPRRFSCRGEIGQDLHVVAFIDSFGVSAIPFLAANFNELTVIWDNRPDPALAQEVGADLVLNILVERRLSSVDPRDMVPHARDP